MTACRCGARWTARRIAHCPSCHRTFGGVTGYDRHRRGGRCLDPADVGLVPTGAGLTVVWRNPRPAEQPPLWETPGGGHASATSAREEVERG